MNFWISAISSIVNDVSCSWMFPSWQNCFWVETQIHRKYATFNWKCVTFEWIGESFFQDLELLCFLTDWINLLTFETLKSLFITFKYKFKSLFHNYQDGRAVKALDLRSNRQCLRGFESHSWYFCCWLYTLYFWRTKNYTAFVTSLE